MVGGDSEDQLDGHRSPERVREVYEAIAEHFSKTREYPWPEVREFVDACDCHERALDIGCGNGRHLGLLWTVADSVVGFDVSENLLREARERASDGGWDAALVQGDAAGLPFQSATFDIAVYVATLHHLPSRERRRRSLDELARVLRSDGRALVSAWCTEHDRFDAEADTDEGFDTTVDWTLPGGETVPRFYHIYAPAEFEADLRASGLTVEENYVSSGNCYAEVSAGTVDGEGKRP